MAFKGMNPDEGREVASAVMEAAQTIFEMVGDLSSVVNGVEWVGPDYDSYREDWNTFIGNELNTLITTMQDKSKQLDTHAEQQDTTSNAG